MYVNIEILESIFFFQVPADPLKITRGLLKSRWIHLHIVDLHGRVMIDMDVSGGLAHHLLACPGLLRHKDQYIPFQLGDAT